MNVLPLSDTVKGILLIVSGTILLVNTLGFSAELLNNIILFGSIAMIVIGIFMANIHKRVIALIVKKEKPQKPQEPRDPEF